MLCYRRLAPTPSGMLTLCTWSLPCRWNSLYGLARDCPSLQVNSAFYKLDLCASIIDSPGWLCEETDSCVVWTSENYGYGWLPLGWLVCVKCVVLSFEFANSGTRSSITCIVLAGTWLRTGDSRQVALCMSWILTLCTEFYANQLFAWLVLYRKSWCLILNLLDHSWILI